ncbi:MAG: RHS repeat-associated core domain-containing protein [Verrucomicrobiota bacterium]
MNQSRFLTILALTALLQPLAAETATIEGAAGGASDDVTVTVINDSDRDGLTDLAEDTNGNGIVDPVETDPQNPDSDGDGISDGAEVNGTPATDPKVNQFAIDTDWAGLPPVVVNSIIGFWDFETFNAGFPSRKGSYISVSSSATVADYWDATDGLLHKSGRAGGLAHMEVTSKDIWSNYEKWTTAMSIKFDSIPSGAFNWPILSTNRGPTGSTNTLTSALILSLRRDATGGSLYFYLNGRVLTSGATGIYGKWLVPAGVDLTKWTDLLFYSSDMNPASGQNRRCFVNGLPAAYALSAADAFYNLGNNINQGYLLVGAQRTNGTINRSAGAFNIDRLCISNYVAGNIEFFKKRDTDGDGATDREELSTGSNPFVYESDTDRDGLTNAEELSGQAVFDDVRVNGVLTDNVTIQFGQTKPNNFDSDGDLFDDYWEAKYFSANVNPNDASKPINDNPLTTTVIEGDYDNDGLSNFQELLYGTNPNSSDTDGDGISDADEAAFGSSPLDGAEKPLDPADFFGDENLSAFTPIGNLGVILKAEEDKSPVVTARVGDPSSSHSERWRLLIGEKQVVARNFGVLSDPIKLALDPKDFHEIRLEHVGTDPAYLAANNNQPDYDYWAAVRPGSGSPFILCDLEGLLQNPDGNPDNDFVNDVDPQLIGYKTAYLVPLDNFSWATSFSGGDAVGPRHRKVGLNGRPIPDEKPQQEEESDLPDEETYIDAYNLNLNHDTTFAYTPLGASDLVLQASASTAETGFTDRSGLRPSERFDLPFGAGWTSSLCAYVEVIETIGGETTDPITVNVIDEAGRQQRFGTVDFKKFFPWPSSRVDKKTYLNTLTRNGENFTLTKKFGNTATYNKCKTWFMYSTDRLEGSTQVKRHTYWRLAEARDRYGVRLQYVYDSSPGVPNDVSLIPRKIFSPDREGQFLVIDRSADYRRVESITDSRGNITSFNYNSTLLGFETSPGVVGDSVIIPRLASIGYADGTASAYVYQGGLEVEVDATDPAKPRWTRHYHANIRSITDPRGNTHSFTYAFDQTKKYWDSSVNGSKAAIDLERLPTAVKEYVEGEIESRNDPAKGSWKTMYGMPRRITQVTLPGTLGSASFSPQGATNFSQTVSYTTLPSTTVTDAVGNATIYQFKDMSAELVDVDTTSKSVSAEWMVYYLTSEIHHYQGQPGTGTLLGTEKYEFDKASGLSLRKSTDVSGNTTTWEYGGNFTAPHGLNVASGIMTKWADPTAKIDALGRREEYTYGAFRVMNQINDSYGTLTNFTVDGLGRRKTKDVLQGGTTLLQRERYDYNNPRFQAFQTSTTTVAHANFSGQPWETDLTSQNLPDDHGRLWREIVDPQELKLTSEHTYDFNNNKTSTIDPRGNRTRFKYDKRNRLTEVIYPSAGTRNGEAVTTKQIWYDRNGNKAAEIDEEGNYTIHHYDALNRRITTIRDMDGAGLPSKNANDIVEEASKGTATGNDLVTQIRYDSVNSATHSIDAKGNVTRTFYDAIRRPLHAFSGLTLAEAADLSTATAAAAASTEKTHNEFKYELAKNTGSTGFDSSGFKPTEIIGHNAVLTATGTKTLRTRATYDKLYRAVLTEAEYESGTFATTTNAYGTITAEKETRQTTVTDARGKITRTLMDGLMRPTSVTDAFNTALASTSQTQYSSTGLVWKTVDPLGREAEEEYDGAGRAVVSWMPDPVTGIVNRSSPQSAMVGSPSTETEYDPNGNVIATINPLGQRWDYTFDARNRRTRELQPAVTKTEVVGGLVQTTPNQRPQILSSYDGVGNVLSVTDSRGHITRSFYDKAYRAIASLANPLNGNPSGDYQSPGTHDILTVTTYDAAGNAIVVSDGNGNATRNQYDSLNRLTATATNPADGQPNAPSGSAKATDIVVRNQYDDSGNLLKVTDGEGHVTGFRYDGMSRKTRTLWDEGSAVQRTETSTYDGLVQITRTNPNGQLTTYLYDDLHRVAEVQYSASKADKRVMTYDLVGNMLAVSYPNETDDRKIIRGVAQGFDKLNRITSETSAGSTHAHTYDKAGNRRSTEYGTTGRTLVSNYDSLNRLQSMIENGTATTGYHYDLAGSITRKVLPNGTETRCTFDTLGRRLSETTQTSGGGMISAFDYSQAVSPYPSGYDHVGNVLKITETYANLPARSVANIYDRAYRLSNEAIAGSGGPTVTTSYAYDKNNNRTLKVVVGGSNPGTWISKYGTTADGYNSNQLRSVSTTNIGRLSISFFYDPNGNRIEKRFTYVDEGAPPPTVSRQYYSYDSDNRLVSLNDSVKGTFLYTYDHRSRRSGRDESLAGGVSKKLSFSGGMSVQEFTSGSGTPDVETIRGSDYGGGIGGVLYTIRGTARSYNAYNSRGDVVSQTNDTASITWQAAYEAFGKRTAENGSNADRQRANTKDEDPTGLLNEGFRYRDLEFGVFLTRDPLGFVDGPNDYTYVRQNPWTAFDPDGLFLKWLENAGGRHHESKSLGLGNNWGYTFRIPKAVRDVSDFDERFSLAERTGGTAAAIGVTLATGGLAAPILASTGVATTATTVVAVGAVSGAAGGAAGQVTSNAIAGNDLSSNVGKSILTGAALGGVFSTAGNMVGAFRQGAMEGTAIGTANGLAVQTAANGATGGAANAMVTANGQVFTGLSKNAGGGAISPSVGSLYGTARTTCAEARTLTAMESAGVSSQGAVSASASVGVKGVPPGTPMQACDQACAPVLRSAGIRDAVAGSSPTPVPVKPIVPVVPRTEDD